MIRPWEQPSTGAPAALVAHLAASLPRIETERLILRAPRIEDWQALSPIWTTEQAKGFGGPFEAGEAWVDFGQLVASWLLRGIGPLTVEFKGAGTVLGLVSLDQEYGDPEREIGWLFRKDAEGQGYALEASRAMLNWAREQVGPDGFATYIAEDHARSIRLAEALGGKPDGTRHPEDPEVLVYRFPEVAS